MMIFPFKTEKAIQAIGVLFRRDGVKRMSYMRLLKLLYVADREAIMETDRAIIGGSVVAMERGPVLENVYELIRGQHAEMPLWDKHFKKDRYSLELVEDPDVKKLSKYEIQKLQEISKRFENADEWELSKLTHGFHEWEKNNPGASSKPICIEDILEGVGRADATQDILQEVRHLSRIRHELGIK